MVITLLSGADPTALSAWTLKRVPYSVVSLNQVRDLCDAPGYAAQTLNACTPTVLWQATHWVMGEPPSPEMVHVSVTSLLVGETAFADVRTAAGGTVCAHKVPLPADIAARSPNRLRNLPDAVALNAFMADPSSLHTIRKPGKESRPVALDH